MSSKKKGEGMKINKKLLLVLSLIIAVGVIVGIYMYAAPGTLGTYTGSTSTINMKMFDYYSCKPVANVKVSVFGTTQFKGKKDSMTELKANDPSYQAVGYTKADGTLTLSNVPYGYEWFYFEGPSGVSYSGLTYKANQRSVYNVNEATETINYPRYYDGRAVMPMSTCLSSMNYTPPAVLE